MEKDSAIEKTASAGSVLQHALEKEINTIEQLLNYQQDFQKSVVTQNWKNLEYLSAMITEYNNTLLLDEQNRAMQVRVLRKRYSLRKEDRFFALLEYFSEKERIAISNLYRRRTILLLKLKALHEHITYYIREMLNHYEHILSSLFSDRFAGTYSIIGLKDRMISGPVLLDWSS